MATVVSLTEAKIQELLAGLQGIGLSQDEINALVIQLRSMVESQGVTLDEFQNNMIPTFVNQLNANDAIVANLNDNILPGLETSLDNAQADIQDMATVTIPGLQTMVSSNAQNLLESPKVYVQPDEPTNPDADDRDLIVGDTWFDSDNNNTQKMWNGVEWSTYAVDIPDLSLTVQKFKTNTHMIY
jgi:hypothetical protein